MNAKSAIRLARKANSALNYLVIIAAVLLFISGGRMTRLPPLQAISDQSLQEPVQTDKEARNFSFDYRGHEYVVYPKAEYELHGLVVSHNDITAWWDIYHDKDSVDIKDLCVVWGDNIKSGVYQDVDFHNESVSCHYYASNNEIFSKFNPEQFSNNHLLSDSESVRESIRNMQIGDQVVLKGKLVDYHVAGSSELVRKTSLTRRDTSGGACEVFFVDEAEILYANNRGWRSLYNWAKRILFLSLIMKVLLFISLPWMEYRYL